MVSIRASLTQFYLRHSQYKKIFSAQGGAASAMDKLHAIPAALPSARFRRKYQVSEEQYQGQAVYTIAPLSPKQKNGRDQNAIETILYFHGGGYVGAISLFHWMFIGQLVDHLGVTIVVPFYPRAPKYNVDDVFNMVMPFYDDLILKYNPQTLMVMGDSAGAGLSLALTQNIIAQGKTAPAKITLLSPWLDARGNDPRQITIEKHDCILGIAGLQAAGKAYAGDNDIIDPRVSPGLAPLDGLPPIAIFAGTHDILITDALNFKAYIENSDASIDLRYYEYDKLHHVWMLVPCPESYQCLTEIAQFAGIKFAGIK